MISRGSGIKAIEIELYWEGKTTIPSSNPQLKDPTQEFLSVKVLTEVAGEGGTNCPPQKFLLSQQFRYLMRCKKYLKKIFYLA